MHFDPHDLSYRLRHFFFFEFLHGHLHRKTPTKRRALDEAELGVIASTNLGVIVNANMRGIQNKIRMERYRIFMELLSKIQKLMIV